VREARAGGRQAGAGRVGGGGVGRQAVTLAILRLREACMIMGGEGRWMVEKGAEAVEREEEEGEEEEEEQQQVLGKGGVVVMLN